jgi:hypothetical protein
MYISGNTFLNIAFSKPCLISEAECKAQITHTLDWVGVEWLCGWVRSEEEKGCGP